MRIVNKARFQYEATLHLNLSKDLYNLINKQLVPNEKICHPNLQIAFNGQAL